MKRILLLALFVSTLIVVDAQVVSSTSSLVRTETRDIDMYVKVGVDIGCSLSDKLSPKTGFSLLYGTTLDIGKNGLYYGVEAGLVRRKSTYTTTSSESEAVDVTETIYEVDYSDYSVNSYTQTTSKIYETRTTDVQTYKGFETFLVPVKLGYKFSLNDQIKLDASIGFYTSFGFNSEYSGVVTYKDYVDGDYVSDSSFSFDYSGAPAGNISTGLIFGVGAWYDNKYNFSLEYQQGLTNAAFEDSVATYIKLAVAMKVNKPKEVRVSRK